MDVENLTLSQWLNALKLSHLSALIGLMALIGTTGYFFGSRNLEASILNSSVELRKEVADLQKTNADLTASVDYLKDKYNKLLEFNKEWSESAARLKSELSIARSTVDELRAREDELNSCQFTQSQIEHITDEIKAKKDELDNWPSKYSVTNPIYIANLESRLGGFQKSLQSCNLRGL